MGLRWEGETHDDEHCDIFPCNWRALRAFLAMESQWRLTPSGRHLGLDYAALTAVPEMRNLTPKTYRRTFERLRVLEAAALERMEQKWR